MDFAALVDLKEKSNIDWENYPLKESVFYKERGANELTLPKVNRSFPTPDAEIRIILHKDHKVYYFPPLHLVPNTLDTPQKGNEASDEI